jgi:glutamate synthase domain-containing protein 3
LLGAESYGFGTAALVAIGCAMARQCHLNSCPTGIASQRPELRAKFTGTPEQVIAHLTYVAEDVRAILASLGVKSLNEIIGRADLLRRADRPEVPRSAMLDLSLLLSPAVRAGESPRRTVERNARLGLESLDAAVLREAGTAIAAGTPVDMAVPVRNHHLSVGARIAGSIAEQRGDAGLPDGTVRIRCTGSAGQSFGAFAITGMRLDLEGQANDYVGKGLNGGEITIRPFANARYAGASHLNMILGNTALYGATSGRLFAAGQVGDRFGVRNSGAIAVVEGTGNHACEYMTGGIVVVLGRAGRNFGAGMSNGVAYVLDESGTFASRVNHDMVQIAAFESEDDAVLRSLVALHLERTASPRARALLEQWERTRPQFRKVEPKGASQHVAAVRQRWLERVTEAGALS